MDTAQKIPLFLQVFVLPFIRGKAVAKQVSTHSSMLQLGWISGALREDLTAVTQAFSALCRNRAYYFILHCFQSWTFLEQEINTKMESSLPLTWQWLSDDQTQHLLKSKGKKNPSASKDFGSRPRRTSSNFWGLLGYWKIMYVQCFSVHMLLWLFHGYHVLWCWRVHKDRQKRSVN